MTSTTDAQYAADAAVAAVNSSTSAADALAHHVATTSANHVQLTGDKLDARDDAYTSARGLVATFSVDAIRDVLDSYTSARSLVDRDCAEWWAIHGAILAARDELRARGQQLLDLVAEFETSDTEPADERV